MEFKLLLESMEVGVFDQEKYDEAKRLIKTGVNLNNLILGMSPLIYCVINQHFEIAELLIKHGVDINYRDEYLHTALYYLLSYFDTDIPCFERMVGIFMDNDADINVLDEDGDTIFSSLIKHFNKYQEEFPNVEIMKKYGARLEP